MPDDPTNSLNPATILKLRLTVARFGEMDGAGWWNTKGVLGSAGKSMLARGFPMTHLFAQARITCTVAASRCASIFTPPGCLTLWNLPSELEDQIATSWPAWCREPDQWLPFFNDISTRNEGSLIDHLRELHLIDEATESAASTLKRSAEGKSVPLPGTGHADLPTVMLLAAAFSKGEKLKPAIPYLRCDS